MKLGDYAVFFAILALWMAAMMHVRHVFKVQQPRPLHTSLPCLDQQKPSVEVVAR